MLLLLLLINCHSDLGILYLYKHYRLTLFIVMPFQKIEFLTMISQ